MTLLTKKQACELLYISDSTFTRRLRKGQYTCQPKGVGKFAPLSFSFADIGLTEPVPVPEPVPQSEDVHVAVVLTPVAEPEPEPTWAPRPLSPIEQKEADDRAFAARYIAGLETDSAGNRIDQKTCSLLGPRDPDDSTPAETQSHMHAGLLATNDELGNAVEVKRQPFENGDGFTRGGTPLCAGFTQEAYDAAMRQWRRAGGGRSEGEMEIASRHAVQNIARSFPSSPRTTRSTVK